MENPLANLKIDSWYKGVVAVAAVVLVASITVRNDHWAMLALGFLFTGFGEWVNHPTGTAFIPGTVRFPAGTIEISSRRPSAFGVFLDIIGVAIILFGLYRLL